MDATATFSSVIGSSVVYQHKTDGKGLFGGFDEFTVTKAVNPNGVERDFRLGDKHFVSDNKIFNVFRNTPGDEAYGLQDIETGQLLGFSGFVADEQLISEAAFFEGVPHVIINGDLFRVAANGRLTELTDPRVSGSPIGENLGFITEIAVFDSPLYLEAVRSGPGGIGLELFKVEGNQFSLVANLTPGQAGSNIRFMGWPS